MKTIKSNIKNIWENHFWPVNLLKDCSVGTQIERYMAYKYNKTKFYLLQLPILNWIIFAIFSYGGLVISELIQKSFNPVFVYLAAFFGISFAFSFVPSLILCISYIFLKHVEIKI